MRALPFDLTNAQARVIEELRGDLGSTFPMNRLLQGDVGSGKTVVAIAAMLLAVEAGFQAALMAPTQILAEQHYAVLRRWLEPLGVPSPADRRAQRGPVAAFCQPSLNLGSTGGPLSRPVARRTHRATSAMGNGGGRFRILKLKPHRTTARRQAKFLSARMLCFTSRRDWKIPGSS